MPLQKRIGKVQRKERKEGRERGNTEAKEVSAVSCFQMRYCHSPSHPLSVPEQCSCSQKNQQQQQQHWDHYRGCAYTHTNTHKHQTCARRIFMFNERNVYYGHFSGSVGLCSPEPEVPSLLATDSQRCPTQPGEHLHTHTPKEEEIRDIYTMMITRT